MYCAPVKSGKTPRSLRTQRHTDTPRTPKVGREIHLAVVDILIISQLMLKLDNILSKTNANPTCCVPFQKSTSGPCHSSCKVCLPSI